MPDTVQALYTHRAHLYDLLATATGYRRAMRSLITSHCTLQPGMRILDAGCGSGIITQAIHAVAAQQNITDITYHGFDRTPAMLNRFQTWITAHQLQDQIHLKEADVLKPEQLPKSWNNYNLITVGCMLEYLSPTQAREALINLTQLLAPDGRIMLVVTRNNWFTRPVFGSWWRASLYTPDQLQSLLRGASLSGQIHPVAWPYGPLLMAVTSRPR